MWIRIFGLISGAMAPIVLFSGGLIVRSAIREQTIIVDELTRRTEVLAENLNRNLEVLEQPLFTLAASMALQQGDLALFHGQASLLAQRSGWNLSLSDRQGNQLLNTRSGYGAVLRQAADSGSALIAIETGRAAVSDLVVSGSDGRPVIALSVPVTSAGCPQCALSMNIINAVTGALTPQSVYGGGYSAVVDSTGHLVARLPARPDLLGRMATPVALAMFDQSPRGTFRSESREGVPTFTAFSHVGSTGWAVSLSIPQSELSAPIGTALWTILPIGLASLLLAVVISGALGRRLTGNMRDLAGRADALGQGIAMAEPRSTGIREIDAVSHAMVQAVEIIRSRTIERAVALEALQVEADSRERAEKRLVQAQKLEAIGRLTNGIAHDFNNILGAVVGCLEAAERHMTNPAGQRLLGNAIDAAEQGSEQTRRLLAFARQQPLAPQPIDLNDVVSAMAPLLSRSLGGAIAVTVNPARDLWPALADRSQVQDALLNLSINARDAMPAGGALRIETGNAKLGAGTADSNDEVTPGDYVMLRVTDEGTGMSPAILSRVLEPFYTTKEEGRGSGLGLSMVYGFARQSAGHLAIQSEVGRGTVVSLYLPRSHVEVATNLAESADEPQGRGEHILVVEDFDVIREATVWALNDLGYETYEARDATEALAILHSGAVIDLLFSDIIMPGGIDGRALAAQAMALRPGLPVLLASGNHGGAGERNVTDEFVVLGKPYRRSELASQIRAALDAA